MTYFCPLCGKEQAQTIMGHRGSSTFSWEYDFTCEHCNRIISFEDWGLDYSKDGVEFG